MEDSKMLEASFVLSAVLQPHHKALRDIAVINNDLFATVEDGSRVSVWERSTTTTTTTSSSSGENSSLQQWHKKPVYPEPVHSGALVFCVVAIPPHISGFPANSFVSGGNDKLARVWTAEGSELGELKGHTDNVNSVSFTAAGEIVTGGWDGSVRYWEHMQCTHTFSEHKYATEVLGLPNGCVVSASTSNCILIHGADKRLIRRIADAHTRPIRRLIVHPLGFASCSNDGYVKVWTADGECVLSIAAHLTSKRMDSFVYGITLLPDGRLVSCGEDCSVKVWAADGTLDQDIKHPSPVRSVAAFPSGDFATACTDQSARIFTRDDERVASVGDREQFDSLAKMAQASILQDMDVSALPTEEEVMATPGTQDGAVKVVQRDGKAVVLKWDAVKGAWEMFGEAMGMAHKGTIVDGEQWDVVTDVYVSESVKHQLCFNRNEDPQVVASRFIAKYNLPEYTGQQIVEHVTPLVDWDAVQHATQLAAQTAAAASLQQVPLWRSGPHLFFPTCKTTGMQRQLLLHGTNDGRAAAASADSALTATDEAAIGLLMRNINDGANYHINSLTTDECAVVEKMMVRWPDECMLPVVDMYRMLMLHTDAVKKLAHVPAYRQRLVALVSDANTASNVKMMVLRGWCNWMMRRIPTAQERNEQRPSVPVDVSAFLTEAIDAAAVCARDQKEAVVAAYISFLHNVVHWLGALGIVDNDLYLLVASGVWAALDSTTSTTMKAQTVFYALLIIGSIGELHPSSKKVLLDMYASDIRAAIADYTPVGAKVPAVKQVLKDLEKVFFQEG